MAGRPKKKRRELSEGEKRWFAQFWREYPKKRAIEDALNAWKDREWTEEGVQKMLASLRKQKECRQWSKDSGDFVPYPATWLNRKQDEDELETAKVIFIEKLEPKCRACGYNRTLHDLRVAWTQDKWRRESLPDGVCRTWRES